ncbi:la-related protein 1C-like [Rutidosis leptorrhynchoides]|uniref:la-related protein 1C-like n=1 Tax=Rutidosis leptorrhynchoides TaxID=125765 RepID=UPI003A9A463B
MTAESSAACITHSGGGGGASTGVNWAQVVRGGNEHDMISPLTEVVDRTLDPVTTSIETQSECSDGVSDCNVGGGKKSAWNKPSAVVNGVVDGGNSPVMGDVSWPALSESTRPGVKSGPSSKPMSDISVNISQTSVVLQQSKKHVKSNAKSHTNQNNAHHRRNRPSKRGGGGVSAGYSRPAPPPPPPPPLPPPFPIFDVFGNMVPQLPPPTFNGNNWSPRSIGGGVGQDHNLNRNLGQRNNFGPRPVINNSGRRDHNDSDWRAPSYHQMGPPPVRGFIRPHSGPFIPHHPVRAYGAPMGYDMGVPFVYLPTIVPDPYRGGAPPLLPPGALGPGFIPLMDPPLDDPVLKQIEYYFSDDNLVKDNFLRSHMDEEGWVPISLIAGFRRVQLITKDIQVILTSLRDSTSLEIQGDKVRRRTDWRRWIQSSNKFQQADTMSQSSHEASENNVEEASLQKLTLQDGPTKENEIDTSDFPKLANREVSSDGPSS